MIAHGRPTLADPITSRDFGIDFYDGIAIGNTTQVGMGGAGAALVTGSAGSLLNPAAPAIRASTDHGRWGWDYHLDALTAKLSTDYDNNGVQTTGDGGASFLTFGLSIRAGKWGIAGTYTIEDAPLVGSSPLLDAQAVRGRFVVARWFAETDISLGFGVQQVAFDVNESERSLFSIAGTGAMIGATWVPNLQRFRIGASYETPILGAAVKTAGCDPMDCRGYILPGEVESSGRVIAGAAYRFGPTAWNQLVLGPFRDERAVTVAADVLVTDRTPNGYGLEAFGMQELQRSGRHVAVSVRGGVDYELEPGKLRLRAGSYWEPARFDDVSGRLHVTAGADLRVFSFHFLGPRRLRLSATGDVAARYRNIGISVGFWH